jgi:alkylated DNA repair dioxygenase AlkB
MEHYKDYRFHVAYQDQWLEPSEADQLFQTINNLYKPLKSKRQGILFGDCPYSVTYGGKTTITTPEPFPPYLIKIKERLENETSTKFNICAVQRYPSGKIGINPHRDKEMTKNTIIAGISLGETRNLTFHRWQTPALFTLTLNHGSLYMMLPPTNDYFAHCIPKDVSEGVRISLTFRNYKV